jgi:hypothetical protein
MTGVNVRITCFCDVTRCSLVADGSTDVQN